MFCISSVPTVHWEEFVSLQQNLFFCNFCWFNSYSLLRSGFKKTPSYYSETERHQSWNLLSSLEKISTFVCEITICSTTIPLALTFTESKKTITNEKLKPPQQNQTHVYSMSYGSWGIIYAFKHIYFDEYHRLCATVKAHMSTCTIYVRNCF